MKLLIIKHGEEYILGMGDIIDCLPLINSFKEPILLPIQTGHYDNMRCFLPKDTNIKLYQIPDFPSLKALEKSMSCIRIESSDEYIEQHGIGGHDDIRGIYHKANMEYPNAFEQLGYFKKRIEEICQYQVPDRPYAFVPEGGSSGKYRIDRSHVYKDLEIIVPPQNSLMLKYADIVKHAVEVHCHVTSWQRLIDKIPTSGTLFLHHYARETRIPPFRFEFNKKWKQLV